MLIFSHYLINRSYKLLQYIEALSYIVSFLNNAVKLFALLQQFIWRSEGSNWSKFLRVYIKDMYLVSIHSPSYDLCSLNCWYSSCKSSDQAMLKNHIHFIDLYHSHFNSHLSCLDCNPWLFTLEYWADCFKVLLRTFKHQFER